jgi:hypothetical protein
MVSHPPTEEIVMKGDRPIDRQRNAAGSIKIAGPGAAREAIGIGSKLYVFKDEAIYSVMLADQIDPGRTNPNLTPVQQHEYGVGLASPLVGRTILTAKYLFKDGMLRGRLNKDVLMGLVVEFFEEALALSGMLDAFAEELKCLAEDWNKKQYQRGSSVLLPSVPDIKGKIKAFVQRAEHAAQSLLALSRAFFPSEGGFDSVLEAIRSRGDVLPDQIKFAEMIVNYWKFLRNCRHCVEHPKPRQKLAVENFHMTIDGKVSFPTVEVIHEKTPEPRIEAAIFMTGLLKSVLNMGEQLMAFLADTNVQPAWHGISVVEFPPEARRSPHVRYYFAMNMNGVMTPIG